MKETRAIIVRADKKLPYYNITIPIIKKYAEKIQAVYCELSHNPPFLTDDKKPHYRILAVLDEQLNHFDRYLFLDADILIRKDCPNLFDYVRHTHIGSIVEDVGSREIHRKKVIKAVQKKFGNIKWVSDYTNAGVFVLSNKHLNILKPINGEYWKGWGSVDGHIGYNIKRFNYEIQYLSYKFNHMCMFSEPWNRSMHRYFSFMIHYAGQANFPDKKWRSRLELIKDDYLELKSRGLIDE